MSDRADRRELDRIMIELRDDNKALRSERNEALNRARELRAVLLDVRRQVASLHESVNKQARTLALLHAKEQLAAEPVPCKDGERVCVWVRNIEAPFCYVPQCGATITTDVALSVRCKCGGVIARTGMRNANKTR